MLERGRVQLVGVDDKEEAAGWGGDPKSWCPWWVKLPLFMFDLGQDA